MVKTIEDFYDNVLDSKGIFNKSINSMDSLIFLITLNNFFFFFEEITLNTLVKNKQNIENFYDNFPTLVYYCKAIQYLYMNK